MQVGGERGGGGESFEDSKNKSEEAEGGGQKQAAVLLGITGRIYVPDAAASFLRNVIFILDRVAS